MPSSILRDLDWDNYINPLSELNLHRTTYNGAVDEQYRASRRRRIILTEEILNNPKYKGGTVSAWRMFRELTNKYKEQLNIFREENSLLNVDVDYIKITQKQVKCSWGEAEPYSNNVSWETSNSFKKVGEDLYVFTFTVEQFKDFFEVIEDFPEVLREVKNNTTFYFKLLEGCDFNFVEALRKYPIRLQIEREEQI